MLEDFKNCRPIDKIVFLVLIACNLVALFLLGRAYYGNPDSTISTIKEQQQAITGQVAGARNDIATAREAAAEASAGIVQVRAGIVQSTGIIRQNAEQVDKCRKLVSECRKLAASNGKILDGIGAANSAGKAKAEIHTK